ncbi:hypothetical protein B0H11DRAFT_1910224 [Mycena galericulata]|nr:hypothetical protein B0H11DRAFT_1910224 [Mycena galericulata]
MALSDIGPLSDIRSLSDTGPLSGIGHLSETGPSQSHVVSISSLNEACTLELLDRFVGSSRVDFVQFLRDRIVACTVNKTWRRAVRGNARFWSHLVVSQHVPPAAIRSWLECSGSVPLDVEIIFKGLETYYPSGNPSSRICEYTSQVLPVLLTSVRRWSSLALEIEDAVCASVVLGALRGIDVTSLRSLDLIGVTATGAVASLLDRTAPSGTLPYQISFDAPPRLTHLSLHSVALDWNTIDCFGQLESLQLRVVGSGPAVRADTFLRLFRSAIRLEQLSLGSLVVEFRGAPSGRVALPHLYRLELDIGTDHGIGWFVTLLDMPSLKTVELNCRGDHALDAVRFAGRFSQSDTFTRVSSLIVRGASFPSHPFYGLLFATFWMIKKLDISDCTPSLLQALGELSARNGIILPRLKRISICGDASEYATELVDAHSTVVGRALDCLELVCRDESHLRECARRPGWNHILLNVRTRAAFRPVVAPLSRYAKVESAR